MLHQSLVIVGGGPVGLTLALLLAKQGKSVTIIDPALDKHNDGRVLALSFASCAILKDLNAWPAESTPISCVQISHPGLGVSQIRAEQLKLPELGATVKYATLCDRLLEQVTANSLISILAGAVTTLYDGTSFVTLSCQVGSQEQLLTAELVILAEGGKLLGQQTQKIKHDYQQQALVAHLDFMESTNHSGVAYERFAGLGPLVLLPFEDHYVMVWSLANALAEDFSSNSEHLLAALEQEFTRRLGSAKLLGKVSRFPLKLTQVKQRLLQRVVLVGNSAQTVHPVSAQGLNLGLRDVILLSDLLSAGIERSSLVNYDKLRNRDADGVIGFTHFLATGLERNDSWMKHLRGLGLIALSNLPPVQNFVARSLIFGI